MYFALQTEAATKAAFLLERPFSTPLIDLVNCFAQSLLGLPHVQASSEAQETKSETSPRPCTSSKQNRSNYISKSFYEVFKFKCHGAKESGNTSLWGCQRGILLQAPHVFHLDCGACANT